MNADGQFPYFGSEPGMALVLYGRGIHTFATADTPSQRDGRYRVGYAKVDRAEGELYWYRSEAGRYIGGGDSGGASFAWTQSGYVIVGVHALCKTKRVPGKPSEGWDWVTSTPESADAPVRPLLSQFEAVMGPARPAPPPSGYVGQFASGGPSPNDRAVSSFRHRASLAGERGFAMGFPNFFTARHGLNHVGGTFWLRAEGVQWRNPLLTELGVANPGDFGERMRAAATYASAAGYVAGLPSFLDGDFGDGLRTGVFLLEPDLAEWRDVPLFDLDLHEEDLGDIGKRFRATSAYAGRKGFVGGFPIMFHARTSWFDAMRGGRQEGIVCGTVLLKAPLAEWSDVVLSTDPR